MSITLLPSESCTLINLKSVTIDGTPNYFLPPWLSQFMCFEYAVWEHFLCIKPPVAPGAKKMGQYSLFIISNQGKFCTLWSASGSKF